MIISSHVFSCRSASIALSLLRSCAPICRRLHPFPYISFITLHPYLSVLKLSSYDCLVPLSEWWAYDGAPAVSVDTKSLSVSFSLCLLPLSLILPPIFSQLSHCLCTAYFSPSLSLLQRRKWKTLTCPVSRKRLWGTLRLTASGAWANCWTASR